MKSTIISISFLCLISFTACKKDRECECTTTFTNIDGVTTNDPTEILTLNKVKKSQAKSICQKSTEISTTEGGKTVTTVKDCKLK